MHLEKAALRCHHVAHLAPRGGIGRNGCAHRHAAMLGDLGRHEADAPDIDVAMLARETQFRRQILAHDVAVQQRDRPAAHLAQPRDQGVGHRRLARARQPGEEHREALLAARRVIAHHLRDHLRERIPLRQGDARAHAPPCFRPVQRRDSLIRSYLRRRNELCAIFRIHQWRHRHQLDADIGRPFAQQSLRRFRCVEGLARLVTHRPALMRADDHVRCPIVARHDGLQQRLARAGQAHGQRQRRYLRVVIREVHQPFLPAAQPRVQIHIVRLRRPDDGQHQQVGIRHARSARRGLELQAMQWIARQESGHPSPAAPRERSAHLGWRQAQRCKIVMRGQSHPAHAAAQINRMPMAQQVEQAGMAFVGRTEQRQRFGSQIGPPQLRHLQHCQQHTLRIAQRHRLPGRHACGEGLRYIQHHRQRPHRTIGQPHPAQDTCVIGTHHETRQR